MNNLFYLFYESLKKKKKKKNGNMVFQKVSFLSIHNYFVIISEQKSLIFSDIIILFSKFQ